MLPVADFTGEEDADNAKAFAAYKNEEATREYCKQIRMQVQKIVRRMSIGQLQPLCQCDPQSGNWLNIFIINWSS